LGRKYHASIRDAVLPDVPEEVRRGIDAAVFRGAAVFLQNASPKAVLLQNDDPAGPRRLSERVALHHLIRFRPGDSLFYLCAFVVVAALVLGGGTRNGFLSDVILQLLAVPLLLASLWRFAALPAPSPARWAAVFCGVIVLVPLVQTIPLPPEVWTKLPGRQAEIEALELTGQGLPWMPISLSPQATLLSALSLVVPIAIFLATALLGLEERRLLSVVLLVVGLLSVFLGLSQVAQGPSSPLRFFDISNPTEAVGFFANRNHFAALLYSLTLLAAAWAVDAALAREGAPRKRYDTATVIALVASFTILVVLVTAQIMARSRAGLGLAIVALLGAFALAFAGRRHASGVTMAKFLAGVLVFTAMFATQFALFRVMERFTADPLQDARIPFARTTIEAARDYMPFGSGMGTFVPVYALFEKPHDVLTNTFANRAHNDVLELWLESGAAGLALMTVFVAWFLMRAFALWRRSPYGVREIDAALPRAATLVVGLLIAHSCVDYPLRTGAMMAIFAFACALLIAPPPTARRAETSEAGAERADRGPARPPAAAHPAFPLAPAQQGPAHWLQELSSGPRSTGERWGKDVEWPEAWRPKPPPPKPGDK
jgi:O-antigen ligase